MCPRSSSSATPSPVASNEFELTIEKPGVYGGQCAEFCGLAHGDMYFTVNAMESAEYDAWVAERLGGTPATAEAGTADEEMADEEWPTRSPTNPTGRTRARRD